MRDTQNNNWGEDALVEEMFQVACGMYDKMTPQFISMLEGMAPRERAILLDMCNADTNLTAKEIAQRTRLPEKSISTQINRLKRDGHISAFGKGKGAIYGVSDPALRMWYRYSNGDTVYVRAVISFYASVYSPSEEVQRLGSLENARRIIHNPVLLRRALKDYFRSQR